MRAGRFDDRKVEAAAGALVAAGGELGHDPQPHRVAEGVQYGCQVKLGSRWVSEGSFFPYAAGAIGRPGTHVPPDCTTSVELLIRCSIFIVLGSEEADGGRADH